MNSTPPQTATPLSQISPETLARRRAWRMLKDRMARYGVMIGGFGVIVAILLIFFYLLYVVFPLLKPASAEPVSDYTLDGGGAETLHLAMEEQAEIGVRYDGGGGVRFFATADGRTVRDERLPLPPDVAITAINDGGRGHAVVSLGLSASAARRPMSRCRMARC